MKSFTEPARITWALIWRSTLLAPIFLLLSILGGATWISRSFPPFLILISAWVQDWLFVAIYGLSWVFAIGLWRWSRFRNLWEAPPSLL